MVIHATLIQHTIENPKDYQNLLGLIHSLTLQGKKKNQYTKTCVSIYKQWTIRNEENNPIYGCNKQNKTLRINERMEVKDLYNENYKILKEIKDDSEIVHAHGWENLASLKCLYSLKQYTKWM